MRKYLENFQIVYDDHFFVGGELEWKGSEEALRGYLFPWARVTAGPFLAVTGLSQTYSYLNWCWIVAVYLDRQATTAIRTPRQSQPTNIFTLKSTSCSPHPIHPPRLSLFSLHLLVFVNLIRMQNVLRIFDCYLLDGLKVTFFFHFSC